MQAIGTWWGVRYIHSLSLFYVDFYNSWSWCTVCYRAIFNSRNHFLMPPLLRCCVTSFQEKERISTLVPSLVRLKNTWRKNKLPACKTKCFFSPKAAWPFRRAEYCLRRAIISILFAPSQSVVLLSILFISRLSFSNYLIHCLLPIRYHFKQACLSLKSP